MMSTKHLHPRKIGLVKENKVLIKSETEPHAVKSLHALVLANKLRMETGTREPILDISGEFLKLE